MVQIYVATADIDVNEQLTASNVRVEDWPKSKVPEGVVVDFKEINERFARVRFYQGEPILTPKLANGIEVPAVKIPDGHRVCSLKVQMDTAVSGLVNPGDRVDIFGYFKEGRGIPSTGTREILKNVRVFAVNDQTAQEIDQEGRTIVAKTVSVLVKQDQVAKLMLATELGTLRLALRRPNEDGGGQSGRDGHGRIAVRHAFGVRGRTATADTGQPTGFGHRWFRRFPERSQEPDRSCGHGGIGRRPAASSGVANDAADARGRHAVHLERRTRLAGAQWTGSTGHTRVTNAGTAGAAGIADAGYGSDSGRRQRHAAAAIRIREQVRRTKSITGEGPGIGRQQSGDDEGGSGNGYPASRMNLARFVHNARKYTDVQAILGGCICHRGPVFRMGRSQRDSTPSRGAGPFADGPGRHPSAGYVPY